MATEVIKIVDPDNGSGTDYTSLAAAVAGEARNLVTADEQLTIKCRCTGGTADGAVTISGFTTDLTRFLKIWTDPSESYRHAGIFPASGNKYRIVATSNSYVLNNQTINTYIEGLAIKNTPTGSGYASCFLTTATNSRAVYDSCIAVGSGTASDGNMGYNCVQSTSSNSKYINCIAYGFKKSGSSYHCGFRFNTTGVFYYYNCTSFGNTLGFKREVADPYVYNCIAANNTDDFNGTFAVISYCASDDGDGTNPVDISPGATEADDWAACFTDYANGDFSLKSDSVCVGAGTDDPSSGLYSDDILGNARTSPWDIGAFEYVAAGGATYEESLALSASGAMLPVISITVPSTVSLGVSATQTNSAFLSIVASLSMDANADNDLSPSANMLGGLMLTTECGFSPSVVASLLSALDLQSAAALSPVGILALTAATALSASAGLEAISSVGASTYGVALSLDAQAAIEQAAVNAIAATLGASAVAGIDAIPDYEIASALSLQVDADIQHVCSMAAQAMLSMGVGAEHMPSATAALNASMTLGVDAILQAITQAALPGSVVARVSRVLAENRIVRVARENRISRVSRENRIVRA